MWWYGYQRDRRGGFVAMSNGFADQYGGVVVGEIDGGLFCG